LRRQEAHALLAKDAKSNVAGTTVRILDAYECYTYKSSYYYLALTVSRSWFLDASASLACR